MPKNKALQWCVIATILASVSFIVYCNADLLQETTFQNQTQSSENLQNQKADPVSADNKTPAIYTELKKRLDTIRSTSNSK